MNATATLLQMKTRMAEYANVPQLVAMYDQFRDVVTSDQIPVRLPEMEGAHQRSSSSTWDRTRSTLSRTSTCGWRTSPATEDLDNSLKVSTDGRNLTMHPRLAEPAGARPGEQPGRARSRSDLAVPCRQRRRADPRRQVRPRDETGVLQLVFSVTAKAEGRQWPTRPQRLQPELRDALVERGMKPEEIAFMHDYDNPKAKAKLVEACADGRIRVLITSTKKGGTGLNVQRALKQMVNLDPGGRPRTWSSGSAASSGRATSTRRSAS
ncbi:hypothetical protein GS908_26390 [Rhodococcus hoagii]|nr:hypothetical protein [Prescottella equi]